jgi:hypothetical protein
MRTDKVNAAVSMLMCDTGPQQLILRSNLVSFLGLTDEEWVAVDKGVKDALPRSEPRVPARPRRAAHHEAEKKRSATEAARASSIANTLAPGGCATPASASVAAQVLNAVERTASTRVGDVAPAKKRKGGRYAKKKPTSAKGNAKIMCEVRKRRKKLRTWAAQFPDGGRAVMQDALRQITGSLNGDVASVSHAKSGTIAPRATVNGAYEKITGSPPKANVTHPLEERKRIHKLIDEFEMPRIGNPSWGYLTKDEEDFLASILTVMDGQGFPLDKASFAGLVQTIARKHGVEDPVCGRTWMTTFFKKYPHLNSNKKVSAMGRDRAEQATAEVRDAVFEKYNALFDYLVKEGKLTQAQRDDPDFIKDIVYNMDEWGSKVSNFRSERKTGREGARVVARKGRAVGGEEVCAACFARAPGSCGGEMCGAHITNSVFPPSAPSSLLLVHSTLARGER